MLKSSCIWSMTSFPPNRTTIDYRESIDATDILDGFCTSKLESYLTNGGTHGFTLGKRYFATNVFRGMAIAYQRRILLFPIFCVFVCVCVGGGGEGGWPGGRGLVHQSHS